VIDLDSPSPDVGHEVLRQALVDVVALVDDMAATVSQLTDELAALTARVAALEPPPAPVL
jgi:hypothetical protein